MKFDYKEMEIIVNFFNWIDKTLNNEEKFIIGNSFIEEKETGRITQVDIGYGIELLEFIENLYYNEYYRKNKNKGNKEKQNYENKNKKH